MANFIRFWFPLIVYSGIIFWVSSLPSLETPPLFAHADKAFHVCEYFPFGFLAARAINHTKPNGQFWTIIALSALLAFGYGLSDEFHQFFVEGRSASAFDVLFDTLGGFFGAVIFMKYVKK